MNLSVGHDAAMPAAGHSASVPAAQIRRARARERLRLPARSPADRARRRAFRKARWNSVLVRILRYGLPVVSTVMILGLMFSGHVFQNPLPAVTVDSVDIDGTTLTMERPTINGFEPGNGRYEMEADRAVQRIGRLNVVYVEGLTGRMEQEDGRWATIRAERGVIDTRKRIANLEENIVVRSDGGYRALLESAWVDMQNGAVRSENPVQVDLLNGKLRADTLELVDRGRFVRFDGRVRMTIYLGAEASQSFLARPGSESDELSQ